MQEVATEDQRINWCILGDGSAAQRQKVGLQTYNSMYPAGGYDHCVALVKFNFENFVTHIA